MRCAAALVAVAAACAGDAGDSRHELGGLKYVIPTDWQARDQSEHQTKIIVWSPANANKRGESIALVRTREMPELMKPDFARITTLLADAQHGLPTASLGAVMRLKTKHGLVGAQVEGDFVPVGATVSYHRIHAVVTDGNALVHVLYTARETNRETFNELLDSLTRKAS